MSQRKVSLEREKALVSLLDDPSPVVQEGLATAFGELGQAGEEILRRVVREEKAGLARRASELLVSLVGPDPTNMFLHFIRGLQYELETGLILINRVMYPELDPVQVRKGLDEIAERCRQLGVAPMRSRDQCRVLNRVCFHEYGFRGNTEDFEDPLNSCLEAVLRRRKGLPILLSAVYILIGERVGLDLEPIGLPGRFLVGNFEDREPLYLDPFERGRFRSVAELRNLLARHNVAPEFHHLVPVPVGEVLCRVCRNLVLHFDARRQPRWANKFRTFVREFEETYRRHSEA